MHGDPRQKPPEEQVRAIAAKFFKAFDQAQENAAVISALQSFSSSMGSFLPDLSEQILERGRAVQAWQFPVYGLCASTQA
ncbi:MAG: hypothetical protein DMG08_00195 [Acidobacteria bacterium]|nr:MAG: hypothetical protein DMG08_00195 [Acidobacteriota bacterium]